MNIETGRGIAIWDSEVLQEDASSAWMQLRVRTRLNRNGLVRPMY